MEALSPISRIPAVQAATTVQASRTQSADITIVTEEGDTVTLSASRTTELSFATYNSKGQTSAELRTHTGSEFSMSVEGDLSRRELKDIRRALRIMMKAAEDFAENDPEKAAKRVSKLSRLDHLAGINADFEIQEKVSVSNTTLESA